MIDAIQPMYVDRAFAGLKHFKKKGNYLWNLRCPVCGDSKKDKTKARCYIYKKSNNLRIYCHNCNYSSNFIYYLKNHVPHLYKEYVIEKMTMDGKTPQKRVTSSKAERAYKKAKPVFKNEFITKCTGVKMAEEYLSQRMIPEDKWKLLYHTDNYKTYVNSVTDKYKESNIPESPRLIIPFKNEDGKVFMFQGRSYAPDDKMRYLSHRYSKRGNFYGLERIDWNERIYVVEGALDSLFLPNSLAIPGTHLAKEDIAKAKDVVICYDNDSRNAEVCRIIKKAITNDFKVCIWPETTPGKDVNEMILSGMKANEVVEMIDSNTYEGAVAQLKFDDWRKTDL